MQELKSEEMWKTIEIGKNKEHTPSTSDCITTNMEISPWIEEFGGEYHELQKLDKQDFPIKLQ